MKIAKENIEFSYRLPRMLRKGNVFSCVCLSVSHSFGEGSQVIFTHDVLDLTVHGFSAPPDMKPYCKGPPDPPAGLVAITGDLFKLVHLSTPNQC